MSPNAYYKVLGLSSDASWEDVKKAFRQMARVYHPDVAGPEGTRKFTEITEAYMTLKETIAPGAANQTSEGARVEPAKDGNAAGEPRRESIFRVLWRRLFSRERGARADEDIPPARLRFVESAVSRAESDIAGLLQRRSEVAEKNRTQAILVRLRSRHPGVVMLALRSVSARQATDEIRGAVIDHFKKNIPTSEVLESLLSFFSAPDRAADFALTLSRHARDFNHSDALLVMRWFKRHRLGGEYYAPFLSHASADVIASALSNWPSDAGLTETAAVWDLLKRDEESILLPLLRLLKKERIPARVAPAIIKIMRDHSSQAIRVWASAIVRDQNLG
jgi:curved DNA-binding protein CbpA